MLNEKMIMTGSNVA